MKFGAKQRTAPGVMRRMVEWFRAHQGEQLTLDDACIKFNAPRHSITQAIYQGQRDQVLKVTFTITSLESDSP